MAGKFDKTTTQHVDLSSHAANLETAQGSLVIWFKYTDTSGVMYAIGFGSPGTTDFGGLYMGGNLSGAYADESLAWGLKSGNANKIFAFVRNGEGFYADGKWHCAIIVMDGASNRIYVDGVKQTLTFSTGGPTTGNALITTATFNSIAIGRRFFTSSFLPYNGSIFDVRIYDNTKYISDAEAKLIFEERGADGITKGLKARYRMDEQSDGSIMTSAIDISGNGYNGTPTNSPTIEAAPFKIG
jgi:hypothetical protein